MHTRMKKHAGKMPIPSVPGSGGKSEKSSPSNEMGFGSNGTDHYNTMDGHKGMSNKKKY